MPHYVLTFLVLTIFSSGALVVLVNRARPESLASLFLAAGLIFLLVLTATPLPIFLLIKRRREPLAQKTLFRKLLGPAFFLALGLAGLALLKGLHLLNGLTLTLFLALLAALFLSAR